MSKQKTKKKTGTEVNPISESQKANTVNGKRALYRKTAVDFQSAANEMLQLGTRDMQIGTFRMQVCIKEQINENKEAAAAFQSGVAEMVSGIAAMRTSIEKQIIEHQEYTKQFYG